MTALSNALADIGARRKASDRRQRREFAASYKRDRHTLRYWMFKRQESRSAIFEAHYRPDCPAATRRLCRALWADIQTARKLPQYLRKGGIREQELRKMFTAECWLYFRQRASVSAQTGMGAFLNGLAAE